MKRWLIKNKNNEEFTERIKKTSDIAKVAEDMCLEGKGISVKNNCTEKILVEYLDTDKYFELSIDLEKKEGA